jgi:hypothetical protein
MQPMATCEHPWAKAAISARGNANSTSRTFGAPLRACHPIIARGPAKAKACARNTVNGESTIADAVTSGAAMKSTAESAVAESAQMIKLRQAKLNLSGSSESPCPNKAAASIATSMINRIARYAISRSSLPIHLHMLPSCVRLHIASGQLPIVVTKAELRPNPSLERTSTGLALGPRTGLGHHPLRGPSANPAGSAQLKR